MQIHFTMKGLWQLVATETLRLAQASHTYLWDQPMRGIVKNVDARLPVMSLADGLSNEHATALAVAPCKATRDFLLCNCHVVFGL